MYATSIALLCLCSARRMDIFLPADLSNKNNFHKRNSTLTLYSEKNLSVLIQMKE